MQWIFASLLGMTGIHFHQNFFAWGAERRCRQEVQGHIPLWRWGASTSQIALWGWNINHMDFKTAMLKWERDQQVLEVACDQVLMEAVTIRQPVLIQQRIVPTQIRNINGSFATQCQACRGTGFRNQNAQGRGAMQTEGLWQSLSTTTFSGCIITT